MDEAFGQITAALDSAGLLDNSLIIFTTDVSVTCTPGNT